MTPDLPSTGTAPFAGLRVLQLGSGIPAGYCTKVLIDAGASVLAVEPPEGDRLRRWSAGFSDLGGTDGALFRFLAASRASTVADPADEADIDAVIALAEAADLVVWSSDSPVARHPRLAPAELRRRSPDLVVVAISPFGLTGPWTDEPATDLTLQALSGGLAHRGPVERPPASVGGQHSEWVAGSYAAIGALIGRYRQVRGGGGDLVDVSMLEAVAMTQLFSATTFASLTGRAQMTGRRASQPGDIEPTSDGYVGFALVNVLQHWLDFSVCIGHPEWNDDDGLSNTRSRSARIGEVIGEIRAWTRARTTAQVIEDVLPFRVPVGPIGNGATLPVTDQFVEHHFYEPSADGTFTQPTPPYRVDGAARLVPLSPAPVLGPPVRELAPWPGPPTDEPVDPAAAGTASDPELPFAGLRILDMTAFWAGPSASHVLAMLGAEVIHVESTVRFDGARVILGPEVPEERWWEWSPAYQSVNTNKLGITLDLTRPEGRALLEDLIATSDVLIENYSPRVVESWGFGYERVRELRPDIVMVRMPAFGLGGPWRNRTGFAMTMEQISGLAWMSGEADGPPTTLWGPCDPVAGAHGTMAILVGLERRRRRGLGGLFEVPMIASALNIAAEQVIEHSAYGNLLARNGNRGPDGAPQNLYPCADVDPASGEPRWVAVVVQDDARWAALVDALGRPGWALDPDLATVAGRRAAHDAIDGHLAAWCGARTQAEVVAALAGTGVAVAPVLTCDQQDGLAQLQARGFFETVPHPLVGDTLHTTYPAHFERGPKRMHRSEAPTLGRDNDRVLRGLLGLSEAEVAALAQSGVIGDRFTGTGPTAPVG